MGLWGSLVSLRGLGLRDPGSNPGNPTLQKWQELKKRKHQEDTKSVTEQMFDVIL